MALLGGNALYKLASNHHEILFSYMKCTRLLSTVTHQHSELKFMFANPSH